MHYQLKKPCNECPFLARMPGWIGSYDSAKELHDLVRYDVRMACHKTESSDIDNEKSDTKNHHCVGYAMYMNSLCKVSVDPDMKDFQNSIREQNSPELKSELLFSFDGSALVDFHGK